LEVVLQLIAAGADVNAATTDDGQTAVYVAAEVGAVEVLRALLGANACPTATRTDDGTTPCSMAEQGGHAACVDLLRAACE